MNFADANYDPPANPEPPSQTDLPASEPPGYLWHPIEIPAEPAVQLMEPPPPPPRRIPNLGHTLLFFVLFIPALFIGSVLSFLVFRATEPHVPTHVLMSRMSHEVRYAIATQGISYGVEWGLAALVFSLMWGRSLAEGIHWNSATAKRLVLRLALLGVATGLAITFAGNFLPMPKAPPILEDLTKSRVGAWMLMIFGISVAPLTEELAFRGFLFPGLVNFFRWLQGRGAIGEGAVRSIGIPIAIVLTSIPFAMLHAQQVSNSWGPVLLIGTVSVVLCVVRLITDSVAAGFVVHAVYNFTLFAGLLVQTDGFKHLDKLKG